MTRTRGLVLGPGGQVGTAWMAGLAQGLRGLGVDLADVDVVVGTSAGAIVGAALTTGRDLGELETLPPSDRSDTGGPAVAADRLGEVFALLGADGVTPEEAMRNVGRLAVRAAPFEEERLLAQMAYCIGGDQRWPSVPLLIPVVNAASGLPRVLDRDSGVPLVRAVAASTAMPTLAPPVTIDGQPHMDGALRAGGNADLAEDLDFRIIIEPMAHVFPSAPPAPGEVKIAPDAAARAAMGADVGDMAAWRPSFLAGMAQAATVRELLRS